MESDSVWDQILFEPIASLAWFAADNFWPVREDVYESHSWRVRTTGAVIQTDTVCVRTRA